MNLHWSKSLGVAFLLWSSGAGWACETVESTEEVVPDGVVGQSVFDTDSRELTNTSEPANEAGLHGGFEDLAEQMEAALWRQVEPAYAAAYDPAVPGFIETSPPLRGPHPIRSVVYQARMTWTAAEIARRRPARADRYLSLAQHGLTELHDRFWDEASGGFFWQRPAPRWPEADASAEAEPTDGPGLLPEKHLYGQAFGIYAAATVARVAEDPEPALDLARRAYAWVEGHAADAEHGGYFEALTFAGDPILTKPDGQKRRNDSLGTAYGFKSMNSHIHLLEAYTALYRVWPDPQLREDFEVLLQIVHDRIYVEPGGLNMFFTRDWRAVPNGESFGHDVETAYLMTDAAEALGEPWPERVAARARRLVDHALEWGYDQDHGGFYEHGRAFRPPYLLDKIWWVQAEGFNALALMHATYGHETDRYAEALRRTWDFTARHVIDAETGRWHPQTHRDSEPMQEGFRPGSHEDIYHSGRAMLETADRLRELEP